MQHDRRVPLHPIQVIWKGFTQVSQCNDGLFLLPYMKPMEEILPLGTGVKVTCQRDAPRLKGLLLRSKYEIAEFERLIRVALFASGPVQIYGSNCSERNALKLILCSIDLRKRSGCIESLNGKAPVLLCGPKAANGKLGIALFQDASGKRLDSRHAKVPFGLVHCL